MNILDIMILHRESSCEHCEMIFSQAFAIADEKAELWKKPVLPK
jgi:hypothetical protein